jgi:hypothetical protein
MLEVNCRICSALPVVVKIKSNLKTACIWISKLLAYAT